MSFLGRLFGHPAPAPAPPPVMLANAVSVPDDVAAALTAGGRPLGEAVETALREHLEAQGRDARGMPFWLQREEGERQLEEELRDRLERRRAAEAEGDTDGDSATAADPGARRRAPRAPRRADGALTEAAGPGATAPGGAGSAAVDAPPADP